MPMVRSRDLAASRQLYIDLLGFEVAMDEPGFLMLRSPSNPTTQLILISEAAADQAARAVDISIEVADVDEAYTRAQERGIPIVYQLTDEPWGIRRFFLQDPDGLVINVASHVATG